MVCPPTCRHHHHLGKLCSSVPGSLPNEAGSKERSQFCSHDVGQAHLHSHYQDQLYLFIFFPSEGQCLFSVLLHLLRGTEPILSFNIPALVQLFLPLQVARGGGGIFPSPLPSRGIQRKGHQQFSHMCATGLPELHSNRRISSVVPPRQSVAPDLLRVVPSGAGAECHFSYSNDLRNSSPTLYNGWEFLPHPLHHREDQE